MKRSGWLAAFVALGLVAASCGDDDDGGGDAAPETTEATADSTTTTGATDDGIFGEDDGGSGEDPCEGVTLEATETGVTEDTITVLVMADVGSELAPGLFQGSIDGVKAWAQKVNDNGGLACRQIEVLEADSAINPTETTNGILEACDNALAMVGSTALFVTDITALDTCPDAAGNPTGIADIAERTVTASHSCSPNSFPTAMPNGSCPYSGEGPRDYSTIMGPYQYILDNVLGGGPVEGIYLIPSDLPSAIQSTMPTVEELNNIGVNTTTGEFGVSGRAEQATYGAYIQNMRDRGVTLAIGGSNDQAIIKLRKEALAQGFDSTGVTYLCGLSCYTPEFLDQGGADVDGTYVWMQFLPFEEASENEELAQFLEYMGTDSPASWAAGAWAAGVAFERVVNDIVAADGPNAITRAAIIAGFTNLSDFDANGWFGTLDWTQKITGPCYVMMQVQDGAFVRIHPEEAGTMDCDAGNVRELPNFDSAARFQG